MLSQVSWGCYKTPQILVVEHKLMLVPSFTVAVVPKIRPSLKACSSCKTTLPLATNCKWGMVILQTTLRFNSLQEQYAELTENCYICSYTWFHNEKTKVKISKGKRQSWRTPDVGLSTISSLWNLHSINTSMCVTVDMEHGQPGHTSIWASVFRLCIDMIDCPCGWPLSPV